MVSRFSSIHGMSQNTLLLSAEITSSHDTSHIPSPSQGSYWDQTSELHQDFIILGAGIVGLSTAISLKQSSPDARVLVLEKGTLPAGSSTRNAGFACFGSLTEFLDNVDNLGPDKAVAQVRERWEGLQSLRKLLGDNAMGFRQTGNYELISEELFPLLDRMEEANDLLRPIFNDDVFSRADGNIPKIGFSETYVKALILNQFEGEINSGHMMGALRQKALSLGVTIRYGSQAERPVESPEGVHVSVKQNGEKLTFSAKAVGICINGFISDLFPEIAIKPGRGQILVTAPLKKPMPIKAPFHMGKGFWYFRILSDNRILLGGGRNLNFEGETTTALETTAEIMGPLKKILSSIIIPDEMPTIELTWAGIMGFAPDHLPKIHVIPGFHRVIMGFGCNGMGIARGHHTGQKTAKLMGTHGK